MVTPEELQESFGEDKRECDVCGRRQVPYAEPSGVPLCSSGCLRAKEKMVEIESQRLYEIRHGDQ